MRTIEINGNEFDSLTGFYEFMEQYLDEGECPWGANFDSLDEVVQCRFNYTDDMSKDVTRIVWNDFQKSKFELRRRRGGRREIDILVEIFQRNGEIEFIMK
jgi:hypothetical protein